MTRSKAVEYLDIVLEAHPRLANQPFGLAVKLGREALERIEVGRNNPGTYWSDLLPGEDPPDSSQPTPEDIQGVKVSPLGREGDK